MAETSSIEWTDATWNPVTGCTKVSPGCAHCYIARTPPFRKERRWFVDGTTGVRLHPDRLEQPLRWRKPRRIFVCSLADLFHEDVPDEHIQRVFATMALAQHHTFQVLTKRPERARQLLDDVFRRDSFQWWTEHYVGDFSSDFEVVWPLPNVWIGVSIENARFTWRADVLRDIPAAVRFISAEPLLGSLYEGVSPPEQEWTTAKFGDGRYKKWLDLTGIDWLIAGGESGPGARPMHPVWVTELRDTCVDEATAFFFKQWGEWAPVVGHLDGLANLHVLYAAGLEPWNGFRHGSITAYGQQAVSGDGYPIVRKAGKKFAGRELDGRTWDEFPAMLA